MTDPRPDAPLVEPPQESADPEQRAERQEHLQVELKAQGFPVGTRIQVPPFYVRGELGRVTVIGYIGTITGATRTEYRGRSVPGVIIAYDADQRDNTDEYPTVFALPRLYDSNPIPRPDESFQPMDADARQASEPFNNDRYVYNLFYGDDIGVSGSKHFLNINDVIEVGNALSNCLEGCTLEEIRTEIISGSAEVVAKYRNYVKNISEIMELLNDRIASSRNKFMRPDSVIQQEDVTSLVMLKLNLETKQNQIEQWLEEVEAASLQDTGV